MDVARLPTGPPILRSSPASRTGVMWQQAGMRLVTGDTLRGSAEWPRGLMHCDGQSPVPVHVALQVSRMQTARRAEWEVLSPSRGGQSGILERV